MLLCNVELFVGGQFTFCNHNQGRVHIFALFWLPQPPPHSGQQTKCVICFGRGRFRTNGSNVAKKTPWSGNVYKPWCLLDKSWLLQRTSFGHWVWSVFDDLLEIGDLSGPALQCVTSRPVLFGRTIMLYQPTRPRGTLARYRSGFSFPVRAPTPATSFTRCVHVLLAYETQTRSHMYM